MLSPVHCSECDAPIPITLISYHRPIPATLIDPPEGGEVEFELPPCSACGHEEDYEDVYDAVYEWAENQYYESYYDDDPWDDEY